MRLRGLLIWGIVMICACCSIFLLQSGFAGYKLGRDISGGVRITYRVDVSQYNEQYADMYTRNQVIDEVMDIIVEKIDRRVSGLGTSDHKVYPQIMDSNYYVTVEMGGVDDLDYAKSVIGKTLELTFMMPYDDAPSEGIRAVREERVGMWLENPDMLPTISSDRDTLLVKSLSNVSMSSLGLSGDNAGRVGIVQDSIQDAMGEGIPGNDTLQRRRITRIDKIDTDGIIIAGYDVYYPHLPIWTPVVELQEPYRILNGAYFRRATITQDALGKPAVGLELNDEGITLLCKASERIMAASKQMAIAVGDELVSIATVEEKLCGSAQITHVDDANALQTALNDGAFPAPLILSSEEKISPTLGQQALRGALIAGLVALLGVSLYMFMHYGPIFGAVGSMMLIAYIASLLGITKLLDTVFSLSGIAAIVLSIGMAVDALIIMFSRIEEEQRLAHVTTMQAVDIGHAHSISAIRDGNMTTAIIGCILFIAGTNFFQGFGAMLLITIALTLGLIVPLAKLLLHDMYRLCSPSSMKSTTVKSNKKRSSTV